MVLSGGKRILLRQPGHVQLINTPMESWGKVMQKILISLTILGFILIGPLIGSGHALEFDGIPYRTGSWSQGFIEHSVGLFDTLKVEMVSPEPSFFKDRVFLEFNAADWTSTSNTPDFREAWAAGPKVETLQFTLHFAGELADPLAFEFRAFDSSLLEGSNIRESALLSWSGSAWNIKYNYDDPHCIAPVVPLPGAVLLLGAGLARLAAYARRRREV